MITTINDTLQTIAARHSVRNFQDRTVPAELIETILTAANLAPSAHNEQSWRFFVITGRTKKQLSELVSEKAPDFSRSAAVLLRMAARSIAEAPVVIAVANSGELMDHGMKLFSEDFKINGASNLMMLYDSFRTLEIQSSAAAVQNLLLAATSCGLGAVWLGILYLIKNDVLALLGEPQGEFMAVIPIGYPGRETKSPNKKPLEKIVKYHS
ncbi:MAG TPA: nitroreductase family protein [Bacillota bacterium]|nr:nitroreductase family protein [Bacillota bacterium]